MTTQLSADYVARAAAKAAWESYREQAPFGESLVPWLHLSPHAQKARVADAAVAIETADRIRKEAGA